MIVLALVYVAGIVAILRYLDRRMVAAQRRRESLYFQSSTGLLL